MLYIECIIFIKLFNFIRRNIKKKKNIEKSSEKNRNVKEIEKTKKYLEKSLNFNTSQEFINFYQTFFGLFIFVIRTGLQTK